ncbi:unnamed protein product [Rodentolepis nana]|uniref:DUF4806 domain-containing protein n=1 Tax=Rodentolepis nana TaxID=102285 RepID=A0A0R3T8J0_RODNA|nr:unnamed protein product [Rodentolepis nana]
MLDYNSLSIGTLQEKRDAYLSLKSQASLLPDGGKKLDDAIERINSIIDCRKSLHSPEPQRTPVFRTLREKTYSTITVSSINEETSCSEDEELDDITLGLGSIELNCVSFEERSEEDLSTFPDDPLTPEEIDTYLFLCNIPSIRRSNMAQCHPFILYLGFISANSICLRVIDCLETKNIFSKYGTPSAWHLTSDSPANVETKMTHKPVISHPGSAIYELWGFVRNAMCGSKSWPLFLFESNKSSRYFKMLYCSSSVQHHFGSKNLPRNIRFAVYEPPISEEFSQEENISPGDLLALDDRLTGLAESCTSETMTLSKMKLKSFSWLESPVNYRALLNIAKVPDIDTVTKRSDYLSAIKISNCDKLYEPQATSAPILNSIDDTLLRQLALAGFIPRTLALLAAKGGWRCFAGILSGLGISKDSSEPLAELYRCFMKINRGMAINTDLYKEGAKKASVKNLFNESGRKTKTLLEPLPIQPERPEDRIKITSPPPSEELYKYRDGAAVDSDDKSDSEAEED